MNLACEVCAAYLLIFCFVFHEGNPFEKTLRAMVTTSSP